MPAVQDFGSLPAVDLLPGVMNLSVVVAPPSLVPHLANIVLEYFVAALYVVSADADTQVLLALAAGEQEEVNELTGTGEVDRHAPAYNPNPCFHCKEIGHFRHDCPLLNSPVPVIAGKLHHTLDVETPVGKEMLSPSSFGS